MDSLAQSLFAKIKTLNETVWERRATEPLIADWLDNFAPSVSPANNERTHALYLLSNFMYFGSRQIRELLKALYRDLYRYPIVESIRRANSDSLDSGIIDPLFRNELENTRFLGVGNPSESGCHLLYSFIHTKFFGALLRQHRPSSVTPQLAVIFSSMIFADLGSKALNIPETLWKKSSG
jgi:hypothetical protein